ncbi:hypothetical protein F511_41215 [Dorcoceras hygrometricum]|uniref:Uncharacterized protein n=1 Tax=Dorcoceras hygrometricum TaxID=472368 RepID=A0A2Z7DBL1_9LAMI|nr:hypothetical protein F511_41215 [Dorcoceras hygrometricum]
MGCPGQARTKPRSKIQPSQQSAGDRRRTAAALEARFLRQPALEGPTRSARTKTPQKVGRNKFRRGAAAATMVVAGGGDMRERRGRRFGELGAWLQPESQGDWLFTVGSGRFVQSSPRPEARLLCQPTLEGLTRSARTETPRNDDRNKSDQRATAVGGGRRRRGALEERGGRELWWRLGFVMWIQLAVSPQPLWLRYRNIGLAHRIMVKRLATSPHDPLGITDSACKNQLVVVRVQFGPFNPYIPIRSTTIGKSRVARDLITMHTTWRSNSDIANVTREHCDVLSMQMDSDLVIYRTTLVRTFQVVTIYRVDKSEVLVVLISPHYSKRH